MKIAHPDVRGRSDSTARSDPTDFPGIPPDLAGLLRDGEVALLHVDARLRVKGLTPAVRNLLPANERVRGRLITRLPWRISDPKLTSDARVVLARGLPSEADVASTDGRCFVRRIRPLQRSAGRPAGLVITFTDITRRKVAEAVLRASEEQHRQILDSITEYAILLLDPQGRFLNWSVSAERILGYTPAEALGQPLTLLFVEEERVAGSLLKRELELARSQQGFPIERWHVRKGNERFWGTGVLSALHDEHGQLYGYVHVLRDNTSRKLAEQRLRQAKIDADVANSAKDSFLANISHELRTPLAATLLWAKLLNTKRNLTPGKLREGLTAIEKSAQEQQALIEELMDTSRIASGKLDLERKAVELASLVKKSAAMIRPAANKKNLHLTVQLRPGIGTVMADPLRLQQVLSNLLSNAVKFTPSGGRIRLHLKRQGEEIEIKVIDTGKGISPEFIGRVFDRFTQEERSAIRVNGGLGLGLSISRNLVELHGGSISVHSDGLDKGATFTVRLPLPRVARAKRLPAKRAQREFTLRGRSILLVEDSEQTRLALTEVLVASGANVISASGAQEALKLFNHQRPDLILSDIGLGKVNGYELIRQIRLWEKAQRCARTPAIALTAYADERNLALALRSGFQRTLTKPVVPADVVRTLVSALESR